MYTFRLFDDHLTPLFSWTNIFLSLGSPVLFYLLDIEVISVKSMLHDFNPSVSLSDPDFILIIFLTALGNVFQLAFRLYLILVKKIHDSNEIFTQYYALILCVISLSPIVPVALGSSLKTIHYLVWISVLIVIPVVMIISHNGLNQYFFEKYPKLQQCLNSISDFLSKLRFNISPPPEEDLPPEVLEDPDPYSPNNMEEMANQAANRIAAAKAKQEASQAQALEEYNHQWVLKPRHHSYQSQAHTSQSTYSFNLPNYLNQRDTGLPEIVM